MFFSERITELQAHKYVQVTRPEPNMVAYNAYIGWMEWYTS